MMVGVKIQLRKCEISDPQNWISDNKLVFVDTDLDSMANLAPE